MIIQKKVVKVGNSFGLIINKSIMQKMGLKRGDWLTLNITKTR